MKKIIISASFILLSISFAIGSFVKPTTSVLHKVFFSVPGYVVHVADHYEGQPDIWISIDSIDFVGAIYVDIWPEVVYTIVDGYGPKDFRKGKELSKTIKEHVEYVHLEKNQP